MNMPVRPDESRLWASFGPDTPNHTPRDAGRALGIPPGRINYLCEKWARKGCYDYGVAADLGWKTKLENRSE